MASGLKMHSLGKDLKSEITKHVEESLKPIYRSRFDRNGKLNPPEDHEHPEIGQIMAEAKEKIERKNERKRVLCRNPNLPKD